MRKVTPELRTVVGGGGIGTGKQGDNGKICPRGCPPRRKNPDVFEKRTGNHQGKKKKKKRKKNNTVRKKAFRKKVNYTKVAGNGLAADS